MSLGPSLAPQIYTVQGINMAVNYGAGKVRFPSPVPVGSKLRLGAKLVSVEDVSGDGVQITMEFTFEVEGVSKPSCVAELISATTDRGSIRKRRYGAGAATWDRETLPEGEEKAVAVREMFDTIAPRYDLINRVMTFRLDVRWRKRAIRDLELPDSSLVPTWPAARATCASIWRAPDTGRSRSTSPTGCSPPTAAARRACRPTWPGCRCATALSTARRAGSRCATWSTSTRSSPSWRVCCARAGASPCSTSTPRTTG